MDGRDALLDSSELGGIEIKTLAIGTQRAARFHHAYLGLVDERDNLIERSVVRGRLTQPVNQCRESRGQCVLPLG